MKNKRQIFITTLTVLVSVFFVVGVVKATTTVGLGIVNNSTSSAIGIDLNGAYTTSALQIGTTGDRLTFAADDDHAIDIWSTNAIATAATVRSIELNQVHTGAGVSRAEALTSILTSNVAMGSWANAIFGKIDLSTSGSVTGLAGVVAAELTLPGSSTASAGGEYSVFEAEINCPASCVMGSRPVHVLEVNAWGTNVAQIDTVGYLFDLDGLTPAADKFVSLTSQTVRSKIGDTTRYVVLSQMQDGLGLGVTGTPMVVTTSTKAADIYTTSSAATGTVRSMAINQVQTVESASTIIEALRVNVESAVKTGDWVNAIVGRVDYTGGGNAGGGMMAAITAEVMFPDESMASMGGEYNALALEMGMGSSTVFHTNSSYPYSFLKFSTWGGTEMDTTGYLFYVDGITAAAGKLVSVDSQTLKARVGSLDRYVVLSTAENGLTLSGATGGISVTNTALATGAYNSAIKSVSTLATGGTSEGIAGYFEAHLGGANTYTGLSFGTGTWINIDSGATVSGGVRALDVGVYESGADMTGTTVYAANFGIHLDATAAPTAAYQMRFNTNNTAGHTTPTAWFHASNHEAVASTLGAGTYTTADGYIEINLEGTTYRMPYYLAVD